MANVQFRPSIKNAFSRGKGVVHNRAKQIKANGNFEDKIPRTSYVKDYTVTTAAVRDNHRITSYQRPNCQYISFVDWQQLQLQS
jgi:hypothetical protein